MTIPDEDVGGARVLSTADGPPEELVDELIDGLGQLFDLSTLVDGSPLGEAMEKRLRSLRPSEPPAWGTAGDIEQVAKLEAGPLDFYYRPHLFPDMDPALRLGHLLQFDLLPRRLPAASPLRVAAVLESYCHLSGDLLGWRQDDDELFLWIADVSGHGVRAGLAAAVLYFLVDEIGAEPRPALFAQKMNDRMLQARNDSDYRPLFATGFWLRVGTDGRGAYASCGHPPVFLKRAAGGIEKLGATGMPLGMMPRQRFDQVEVRLEPGDSLCLFTDGLLEARDAEGEEFGDLRLAEILGRQASPPLDAAQSIYQAVRRHQDANLFDDDLTFLLAEPVAA